MPSEEKLTTRGLHALDERFVIPEPSVEQMERLPVFRTTWIRLVHRIRACKQRGISLANLAGTAIGISLTALVKTLTDFSKPGHGDALIWGLIVIIALMMAVILVLSTGWVRQAENVNLEAIAVEMEEIAERYHKEGSSIVEAP
jgi:hypothetical protein